MKMKAYARCLRDLECLGRELRGREGCEKSVTSINDNMKMIT